MYINYLQIYQYYLITQFVYLFVQGKDMSNMTYS